LRLERLTYVHNGDPGAIGRLIAETRGVLKFGGDGSGLLEITPAVASALHSPGSGHGSSPAFAPELSVRISSVSFSALPPAVRGELGEGQIPCILGHSGVTTVTLLAPRSCARVSASLSDLRGKVRFALARVAWEL
jgi:hypothetical protein